MQKEFYDRLSAPFEKHDRLYKGLVLLNRILTAATYLSYIAVLIWLLHLSRPNFLAALIVPAVSFVIVTVFRKLYNAKRPYEVWDIKPLIPKDTKGKSFPSRHAFSIFILAMVFFRFLPPLGILFFVAGGFMAAVRVIGRVHFIKDVIAGTVLGIALGYIGLFLIFR